jgi:two-component system, sensor histidine kinase YesM
LLATMHERGCSAPMFGKMQFHSKLILAYSVTIACVLAAIAFVFIGYSRQMALENARSTNIQAAVVMRDKLDYALREMQIVSGRIQERTEIVSQLKTMQDSPRWLGNRFTYALWLKRLLLDAIGSNSEIYRVSVFNDQGDFLSTNSHQYDSDRLQEIVTGSVWYKALTQEGQSEYLYFPHSDDWAESRGIQVYSIVRPIRYYDEIVGFVEVQCRKDSFDQAAFDVQTEQYPARMIVFGDDRVFYTNRAYAYSGEFFAQHYLTANESLIDGAYHAINPVTQRDEMIVVMEGKSGFHTIIAQEISSITRNLDSIAIVSLMAVLAMLGASLLVGFLIIRRLTVPLRRLKENIDATQADTLTEVDTRLPVQRDDEIGLIARSFLDMRGRLKASMDNEIRLQYLQSKAHFDTLQARINPHYLYNTLGVISGMCYEVGQDEIADMCVRLAEMMRYSVSGTDAVATVREELQHASNYLVLMKKRYEYRLEYAFDVDEAIQDAFLPKLCIQPLIENSLMHGFDQVAVEVMRIQLTGRMMDDGFWEIAITDNGSGFPQEVLDRIRQTIDEYKRRIRKAEESEELTIGGMGIINTFVRIELFTSSKVQMILKNGENGGAVILIRCPFACRKEA